MTDTDTHNEIAGIVAALLNLKMRAAPFQDIGVALDDDMQTVVLQALDETHEWHEVRFRLDRPVADGAWTPKLLYDLLACGKAS